MSSGNTIDAVFLAERPDPSIADHPLLADDWVEIYQPCAFPGFWGVYFPERTDGKRLITEISASTGQQALSLEQIAALFTGLPLAS